MLTGMVEGKIIPVCDIFTYTDFYCFTFIYIGITNGYINITDVVVGCSIRTLTFKGAAFQNEKFHTTI